MLKQTERGQNEKSVSNNELKRQKCVNVKTVGGRNFLLAAVSIESTVYGQNLIKSVPHCKACAT